MTSKSNRIVRVLLFSISTISLGLFYSVWCRFSSLHIPCLFHRITGWYCPGCGVTRMCLALLALDFSTAFYYNKAIFILLPFYILLGVHYTLIYVKTGEIKLSKLANIGMIISIIILIGYGLIRNILPYDYF